MREDGRMEEERMGKAGKGRERGKEKLRSPVDLKTIYTSPLRTHIMPFTTTNQGSSGGKNLGRHQREKVESIYSEGKKETVEEVKTNLVFQETFPLLALPLGDLLVLGRNFHFILNFKEISIHE